MEPTRFIVRRWNPFLKRYTEMIASIVEDINLIGRFRFGKDLIKYHLIDMTEIIEAIWDANTGELAAIFNYTEESQRSAWDLINQMEYDIFIKGYEKFIKGYEDDKNKQG